MSKNNNKSVVDQSALFYLFARGEKAKAQGSRERRRERRGKNKKKRQREQS